jgi:MarR family transcriptional regulator for hemolysin
MNPASSPDLLALLHDVARLIRVEADKRARVHDMTRAQWVLLLKLARHPGLSQKDLAEILEVEPMSVARLTDRLESRGLVERRADPKDRRIWRLHLCPKAEPVLREIEAQRERLADQVAGDLPESMTSVMLEGLSRMKAALLDLSSQQPNMTCAVGAGSGNTAMADAEQELV